MKNFFKSIWVKPITKVIVASSTGAALDVAKTWLATGAIGDNGLKDIGTAAASAALATFFLYLKSPTSIALPPGQNQ